MTWTAATPQQLSLAVRGPRRVPGSASVEDTAAAVGRGEMVVVLDAPERENEGDLVMAAERATPQAINFMATEARGLICVPMLEDRLAQLRIPLMATTNSDPHSTAFHVGVDHRWLATTGISASDRAAVVRALSDPSSRAEDFTQPGHTFPLGYRPGGVLRRPGHTEAAIDLVGLAGLARAAVICEITAEDGEMARLPTLLRFAEAHRLAVITIEQLVLYRRQHERLIERSSEAMLPLDGGCFVVIGYRDLATGNEHLAVVLGDVAAAPGALIRVHSECLTGDVFASRRCDCGHQLDQSLQLIAAEGRGAVVYVRGHEGRGIGLAEKLRAYRLQDSGLDTVEANLSLGHPPDSRDYGIPAQILADLGVREPRLLTNNPAKRAGLEGYGMAVMSQIPLLPAVTTENRRYLWTKQQKLGHWLDMTEEDGSVLRGGPTEPQL